jgi:hypothetical protein
MTYTFALMLMFLLGLGNVHAEPDCNEPEQGVNAYSCFMWEIQTIQKLVFIPEVYIGVLTVLLIICLRKIYKLKKKIKFLTC